VVGVEMDRAVVLGLAGPGVVLAGPVPALHAARRQIAENAMPAARADVLGYGRVDRPREIPVRNDFAAELDIQRAGHQPVVKRRGMEPGNEDRAVELAVEM